MLCGAEVLVFTHTLERRSDSTEGKVLREVPKSFTKTARSKRMRVIHAAPLGASVAHAGEHFEAVPVEYGNLRLRGLLEETVVLLSRFPLLKV